jgi:hypothetical protein
LASEEQAQLPQRDPKVELTAVALELVVAVAVPLVLVAQAPALLEAWPV